MKNLLWLLIMALSGGAASAQKVHFVYFETDNAQPFYLKMDDKVYSSSSAGGFLLPNLTDTIYNLSIGFPATNNEAKFKLAVNGKDYGYAIKTFDFGLGLFDMQSLSVTKPQEDNWKSNVSYQYHNDDFTSLLAKASNDTSLFYVSTVKPTEEVAVQKPETNIEEKPGMKTEAVTDSGSTRHDTAVLRKKEGMEVTGVAIIPVAKVADNTATPYVFPGALAIDSVSSKEVAVKAADSSVALPVVAATATTVLTDSVPPTTNTTLDSTATGQIIDTTVVLKKESTLQAEVIAGYPRSTVKRHAESSTTEGFGLVFFDHYEGGSDTINLIIPNPRISFKEADTTQFGDGMLEIKKDTVAIAPSVVEATAVPKSKCTVAASDNDFFKLRKNMAAKESDEEMIAEAKKSFRSKCYSTGQIKNLSSLFLNDEGKYQFFDAAYTHVTDQEVFYALQAELKDEYYLKRFKALIGK